MKFEGIEYLEWIIGLDWEPEHDLGTSEPQIEVSARVLGLRAADIVLSGHNALGKFEGIEYLARCGSSGHGSAA
ncbi:hypothetical protein KAU04_01930 [bacterium]|nr:hypothetical protein [bacterium]